MAGRHLPAMNRLRRLDAGLPGSTKVRQAAIASLLSAFGGQGFLMLSGVIVARLLGPEQRGLLAMITIVPFVVVQVSHFGLPQATTYFVAKDRHSSRSIARRVAGPAMLQALVVVAVHLTAMPVFLRGESSSAWPSAFLVLATGPAMLFQQYGLAMLQGQRRFVPFNVLRTMPAALYSLGAFTLFLFGATSLFAASLAWTAALVGVAATTLVVTLRGLAPASTTPTEDVPARSEMLRFGLRGFLGAVSPLETFRLDQAVIALFLSPVALGLYVVGLAFTNLPRFIAQAIGTVAYPHIAARRDPAAARHSAWRFFALAVSCCALVVVPLWIAAGSLVPMFFGDGFAESVPVTRIMLIGAMFVAARLILSDTTRGLGFPQFGSLGEIASWAWLLPALALFGPRWGIEGVAFALASASAVSFAVILTLMLRSRPRETRAAPRMKEAPLANAD